MSSVLLVIVGIGVLATIVGMAVYCIKGMNMTVGFFLATALWVILAFIGNAIEPNSAMQGQSVGDVLTAVFQTGPGSYGSSVLTNVIFGAFYGIVLTETGIAASLIRKTVELGGDKPRVTVVLLCIVNTILFTSLTGVGPYIAIGTIILPIMMALGISPLISVFAFVGSAGVSASLLNIVNFQQYQLVFATADADYASYTYQDYFPFALTAAIISLIIILAVVCVKIGGKKKSYTWAAQLGENSQKEVPGISLLSVILPEIFIMVFQFPVILSFILSAVFALVTCGEFKNGFVDSCRKITKYAADGVVSVAPMLAFLMTIAMYNACAKYIAPYLSAVVGPLIPLSALGICIFFGALAIFGQFRGPLNIVGSGVALLTVVVGLRSWPVAFLYPLFIVTTIVPQGLDITLSGAVWAMDYAKVKTRDYMKLGIATAWPICIVLEAVVFFMFGSLV